MPPTRARYRVVALATTLAMVTYLDRVAIGTLALLKARNFQDFGAIKNPKLTFNISNVTDKQFRNPSSTTVINAQPYQGVSVNTLSRNYLGAPRFASATLSVDF